MAKVTEVPDGMPRQRLDLSILTVGATSARAPSVSPRSPTPDFAGKGFTVFSVAYGSLRTPFACFSPIDGGG